MMDFDLIRLISEPDKVPNDSFQDFYLKIKNCLQNGDLQGYGFSESTLARLFSYLGDKLHKQLQFDELRILIEEFYKLQFPLPDTNKLDNELLANKESSRLFIIPNTLPSVLIWQLAHLASSNRIIDQELVYEYLSLAKKRYKTSIFMMLQLTRPLLEVASRQVLFSKKYENRPDLLNKFKIFIWQLMDEYGDNYAFAAQFVYIFEFLRNISFDQAKNVFSVIDKVPESAFLLIYYALYRQNHYSELGEFDATYFKNLLFERLKLKGTKKQSELLRHLWLIIKEEPKEFPKLAGYLTSAIGFIDLKKSIWIFIIIIKEMIDYDVAFSTCLKWLEQICDALIENIGDEALTEHISLPIIDILPIIIKRSPNNAATLIQKSQILWFLNVGVGDLKSIPGIYGETSEANKPIIKQALEEFYLKVRIEKPNLPEATFI